MSIPIQDEPESTIGRKPTRNTDAGAEEGVPARSGADARPEEQERDEHGAREEIPVREQSADRPPNFDI